MRLVDKFCANADWPALLELRNRSRAAVATGRQLWPAATLAEYRLALWAPAEWAAQVLDEESGRFTIGPLTEVVAEHHEFADLRQHFPTALASASSPTNVRSAGSRSSAISSNPLDIPFELQPWEPAVLPRRVHRRGRHPRQRHTCRRVGVRGRCLPMAARSSTTPRSSWPCAN